MIAFWFTAKVHNIWPNIKSATHSEKTENDQKFNNSNYNRADPWYP